MTRDLDAAKDYFHVRYAEAPDARYGLVASSREKSLQEWGVPDAPRPLVRRRRGEPSLVPPPARVRHRVRRPGTGARRRAAGVGDRPRRLPHRSIRRRQAAAGGLDDGGSEAAAQEERRSRCRAGHPAHRVRPGVKDKRARGRQRADGQRSLSTACSSTLRCVGAPARAAEIRDRVDAGWRFVQVPWERARRGATLEAVRSLDTDDEAWDPAESRG